MSHFSLNELLNHQLSRVEIYDGAGGIWVTEGQVFVLNAEWVIVGDEVIPKTSIARIKILPSPFGSDPDDVG
jgi:hypothetical protein